MDFPVWSVDYQAEGEKALSENRTTQAQTYLEAALAQGSGNERLFLDLGLVYQKLGLNEEASKSFRKGAELAGPLQYLLLYNQGLVAFAQKDWDGAESAYTSVLSLRPQFADALLNRANVRLEKRDWKGAQADFQAYQALAPSNPQKETIDKVLALLSQAQADEEAQRLAEETRKKQEAEAKATAEAQAAQEKAEAEAKAAAEQKKQQEILDKIRNSLKDVSGDTKALGTGPAGVKSDDGDFSLSQ